MSFDAGTSRSYGDETRRPLSSSTSEPDNCNKPAITQHGSASFEDKIEQFYMQLTEGKTGGMVACVDEMQKIVDSIRPADDGRSPPAHQGPQEYNNASNASVSASGLYHEMLQDCRRKAGEATLDILRRLCQRHGRDMSSSQGVLLDDDDTTDHEAILVSFHASLLGRAEGAANIYGGFLRNRLRQSNDAALKLLSSKRALYRLTLASGGSMSDGGAMGSSNVSVGGGGGEEVSADPHPHIIALATVLGETSKLIANLCESGASPELEERIARLLHQDTRLQVVKILQWFQSDADLPKWQMQASIGPGSGRASASRSPVMSAPSSSSGSRGGGASRLNTDDAIVFDARGMDLVIDELALACQYCHRYLDFIAEAAGLAEEQSSDFFLQVRVIEGGYVQLEDAYCLRSVGEAMRIAEPIEVQEGTYVSSMVEDASFLVHKSLRRSVSTRSEQAIMAVCNRVTEILDPHAPEPSFYSGLSREADHMVPANKGASAEEDEVSKEPEDFSTALAKALDEAADAAEAGDGSGERNEGGSGRTGALGAGDVDGALVGINSVHVALSSVSAIQDAMVRFLEASNPLVQLMLDEVGRILRAYKELRDSRLADVLEALSPSVSRTLVQTFGSASYAITPEEYGQRSTDVPAARAVLDAATRAMLGGDDLRHKTGDSVRTAASSGRGGTQGTRCQIALLQDPFEELVRSLARSISEGVAAAAKSKDRSSNTNRTDPARQDGGFTEWGALLLRKEVRTLQQGLATFMETDSLSSEFGELNELIQVLNVQRPADILQYRRPSSRQDRADNGPAFMLSSNAVRDVLRLRIEFSENAITALEL